MGSENGAANVATFCELWQWRKDVWGKILRIFIVWWTGETELGSWKGKWRTDQKLKIKEKGINDGTRS